VTLVVVDCFSRQAHFIPGFKATNAEQLAEIFIKEVWKHHGLPKKTISDHGTTFNSNFLRALYQKLQIEPQFSTAYHPETDRLAERTNQWLEGFLRSFGKCAVWCLLVDSLLQYSARTAFRS
jgi:transposase InsO family protein